VTETTFTPQWWLRGPHLQSVLPSLPLRRPFVEHRARSLLSGTRELLLDCGEGVRLQGFFSPASPAAERAGGDTRRHPVLVILLHGWEGSARSLYVLSLATSLHEQGYDVVRLNLRDHGETHHLNRELFHSCRLPEVVGAIKQLNWLFRDHALVLAGFSLGGNFMLRAGLEAPAASLPVARVIGISPLLDPAHTLDRLEEGPALYRRYFLHKWTRSLRRKQALWPEFDFEPVLRSADLRQMTRELVVSQAGFADLESYLRGYALVGDRLASLQVPATLIAALDDPITPASDLGRIARPASLRVVTTETGGHCGFFESLTGPGFIERFVLEELQAVRRSLSDVVRGAGV